MEELMPSLGSPVPSPSVLAVLVSQSESTLQNISKLYSDSSNGASDVDSDNPFEFCDDTPLVAKTCLFSISDDGKLWSWILTAEGEGVMQKDAGISGNIANLSLDSTNTTTIVSTKDGLAAEGSRQLDNINGSQTQLPNSTFGFADVTFKISLVGQLQVLSSTVTMLAVPSPSLTATMSRGGDNPAITVPLVALGSQSGTIDVIDVSANAVASSFSVHNSMVRGLRWLGNSRLVSFSYTQVNEKTGGYINRLVVTCLRSGLNRTFRVLQKPERAPIRALRTSSSGRYLLILFRDAPVEVWAMTKNPIMVSVMLNFLFFWLAVFLIMVANNNIVTMKDVVTKRLRSLALPFTVMEWTLPTVPRPVQKGPSRESSLSHKDNKAVAPEVATSTTIASSSDSKAGNSDNLQDEISESFAFALVNGALGVFEVHGRRIRDFRPKWPSSSFVSSDGLITAMAYRLPHVVMGDRSGNIRWWDVTTGQSSSFNTYREGVRRIKFSPVVAGDRSRGRIAVLFNDNTFSVFDLDSPDPLANSLLQPQFPGTLVLELDWLHLRTDKNDPLVLCMAGADSSFRLIEVNINDKKMGPGALPRNIKERFRPMPLCCPVLLPTPHALALRMILQLGVKPSWFNTTGTTIDKRPHLVPGMASSSEDLRSYLIELPSVGDSVVPELLLKVLEPYRKEGCILDDERARLYATIVNKGCAARFAFAAATFGEVSEALFWLQLPRAINHLMNKLINKSPQKAPISVPNSDLDDKSLLSRITSKEKSTSETGQRDALTQGQLRLMAFEQEDLWESANERIPWHEKLEGEEAIQNHVHE
ncbi:hypothetical protein GOBAR_AA31666 [Gossypium barbadense]|uniref:Uncharacterized protein n=1 Tax=Gossypium barbadense TaxID=3634 RepID=A0A2P5WD65_GOSBA|nr:hypothetical protein GOBAR_AA31666 [Gossypium barbadense]